MLRFRAIKILGLYFTTSTLLLLTTVSLQAQTELDCSSFKKGRYVYQTEDGEIFLIKRKKKKQIEIAVKSGIQIKTQLQWLSNCQYRLSVSKKDDEIKVGEEPIIITIQKILPDNSFSFSASGFDGFIIMEGKMRKIGRKEWRKIIISD